MQKKNEMTGSHNQPAFTVRNILIGKGKGMTINTAADAMKLLKRGMPDGKQVCFS